MIINVTLNIWDFYGAEVDKVGLLLYILDDKLCFVKQFSTNVHATAGKIHCYASYKY